MGVGHGRGQPTSSGLYLHIHKPPHWLAVLGSPHCPQCPWLQQGWACQTCTEKGQKASLPSHRHQACLGRKLGNQNHFLTRAGEEWAAPSPGVVGPTCPQSPGLGPP